MDALILETFQECAKSLLDVRNDFLLLDPLSEWLLRLTVVVDVVHVAKFTVVVGFFSTAHETSLAPSGVLFVS